MRVLVDTSVWADFFNGHRSVEAIALEKLIKSNEEICTCGVVVSEVFQGLKKDATRSRLQDLFQNLTFLDTDGMAPYFSAAELYRALRKRGVTIRSTIDCLIAVIAEENGCFLLAKDKDLRAIIDSRLLDLRSWSG
jgi:predicted nucleic acid-binding protein